MINLAIKNSAYSSLIVKKQNKRFKDKIKIKPSEQVVQY